MCVLKAAEMVAVPEELEELDDPELEELELELFEPELELELDEPELELLEDEPELEELELEAPELDELELLELEEPETVEPEELELGETAPEELELEELELTKPVTDATELVLGALELVVPLLLLSLSPHAASATAHRRTIHGFANFILFL